MATVRLGPEFMSTIHNLEKIRDAEPPPNENDMAKISTQINTLYEQVKDLIDAAINQTTPKYVAAANAMKEAAAASEAAINDLKKVADTIAKVADAIKLITGLLSSLSSFGA